MDLRFLRINLFYRLLMPFSDRMRSRRMARFSEMFALRDGTTILDLGGQPMIWKAVPAKLDITILNLPGIANVEHETHHTIRYVEGDACNVVGVGDKSFDVVFSNSVIEHVGDAGFRSAFAREARRIGKSYWVQTPSKYFPIEPHNGMPFWWFYPASLRRSIQDGWRKKLPEWTEMIDGTDVVSHEEMTALFPEADVMVEHFCGLPKSYIAASTAGVRAG